MKLIFGLFVLFSTCLSSVALSQSIVEDINLEFSSSSGKFGFAVYQDLQASDYTGVAFNYTGSEVSLDFINLDEGSDWYVVNPGDVFSPATIASGQFEPI